MISLAEFSRLAERYTVVPVWRDLLADSETPIGVFRALGGAEGSVLLESVETGERWGRFSFLGLDPFTVLQSHGGSLHWTNGPICPVPEGASLRATLRAVARQLRAPALPQLPHLAAGAICALGGEALTEGTAPSAEGTSPGPAPAGLDGAVLFPSAMVVFDHFRQRLRLVANVLTEAARPAEAQYAEAQSRLDALAGRLSGVEQLAPTPVPAVVADPAFDSETDDPAYRRMVQAAQQRVTAGEVRQVNVSRRFVAPAAADPLSVYRVLRVTNPSPYLYLLRLPGVTLVGSSPQGLVSVHNREITTYALAGTRPRGEDPQADAKLAAELTGDPKERAEHAMLVELAMADLASVARPGTVHVVDRERVVRYSQVMHLVTEVGGALADDHSALDALCAVFPAGTVSGTPRQAALRIARELEPRPRGLYGGAVGYLDFSGDLQTCIGIRALQFAGGMAYGQAAAGVVAGSDPDLEVAESRVKARALFVALATAAELVS